MLVDRVSLSTALRPTHLVASGAGSRRFFEAGRLGVIAVTKEWLEACGTAGRVVPAAQYRLGLLAGLHISVTGMGQATRRAVEALCGKHGGSFHAGLVLHKEWNGHQVRVLCCHPRRCAVDAS